MDLLLDISAGSLCQEVPKTASQCTPRRDCGTIDLVQAVRNCRQCARRWTLSMKAVVAFVHQVSCDMVAVAIKW
jgi:hypothetical protein